MLKKCKIMQFSVRQVIICQVMCSSYAPYLILKYA